MSFKADYSKINEFKTNETAYGLFMVKSLRTDKTTAGKPFMDIEIGDKTGSLIGKLWDVTFQAESLVVGDIVYATGVAKEWNGSLQLKLDFIEKTQNPPSIEEFVPTAPYPKEELEWTIQNYIDLIQDEEIKTIVEHIYEANKEAFLEAPAAFGMHHAVYRGLAYHVATMLKSADKLADVYSFLNRDLLYAGVILHDVAKVTEMEYEHGNATAYSRPGFLLGHIVQGTLLVQQAAQHLGTSQRTVEILQHLIVSHHDKGEWGSPQPPRMAEAIMLHFIDNIDAKMYMAKELIDGKRDGEYTEYHKGIRNKLLVF